MGGLSPAKDSVSVQWRKKGNSIYATATDNISPTLREMRLQKASNCYYKAYNFANRGEETASAAKNLAQTNKRIASAYEYMREEPIDKMIYYYTEAFKYFSLAYKDSVAVMNVSWSQALLASSLDCLESLKNGRMVEETMEVRIDKYLRIVKQVEIDSLKAVFYLELATLHFHKGVVFMDEKNFKSGLYEMSECYFPIQEAKRLKANKDEVSILEEDVRLQAAVGKALQDIDTGSKLLRQVIFEEETVNMDMVWHIVDLFRMAVIESVDAGQMEIEAIAYYRIGSLYKKVLDLKQLAKQFFQKSVQLVLSMEPRNFDNEAWFIDCKLELEAIQKEDLFSKQSQWEAKKKNFLEELKPEIEKLEKMSEKNPWKFLELLYETFPPHNPNHKLVGVDSKKKLPPEGNELKKVFLKACVHYHPDKINKETEGKKLYVLTEEISKIVNKKYSSMKGC